MRATTGGKQHSYTARGPDRVDHMWSRVASDFDSTFPAKLATAEALKAEFFCLKKLYQHQTYRRIFRRQCEGSPVNLGDDVAASNLRWKCSSANRTCSHSGTGPDDCYSMKATCSRKGTDSTRVLEPSKAPDGVPQGEIQDRGKKTQRERGVARRCEDAPDFTPHRR